MDHLYILEDIDSDVATERLIFTGVFDNKETSILNEAVKEWNSLHPLSKRKVIHAGAYYRHSLQEVERVENEQLGNDKTGDHALYEDVMEEGFIVRTIGTFNLEL